jgi:SAM-dependent methyltransferase/uncharacterized protein YbaR (Trm112 family)
VSGSELQGWVVEQLVCPVDRTRLTVDGSFLKCEAGVHRYPVVQGIPVLLVPDVEQTLWVGRRSWELANEAAGKPTVGDPYFLETLGVSDEERATIRRTIDASNGSQVDPVVQQIVAATSGYLYVPLMGKMTEYPIPELRLPEGEGRLLLDIGCNWGRWSVAASRKGYRSIGIDPSLGALLAARRVCRQLGLEAQFVCGDGRFLPFADCTFDVVFSFGVLQHLSRENVRTVVDGIARVLKPGGRSLVQMPNLFGIRNLYHQARVRFRESRNFEVRYWSPNQLVRTFGAIGPSSLTVDGFFGLGIQGTDRHMLPPSYQAVVGASEALRRLSHSLHWMTYAADSVYVESQRA